MSRASLHHSAIGSRDIALLAAVADEGSIRRAAEMLGIAQPSLSKSIRLIEERLGTSLFERSTSGVRPTVLGAELLGRGRQVLLDLDAIQRDFSVALRDQCGEVRVGLGTFVAALITVPVMQAIRAEFPALRLDLRVVHPRDVTQQVESGAVDFGICHVEDVNITAALQSRHVCRLPAIFFARRGHPLAGGGPVAPERLRDYPLTLPHSYARLEAWFCDFTGVADCRVATQGHDVSLVGDLVAQSDDISITSPGILEGLRRRFDLVPLNVPGVDFLHEVQCITPAARSLSAPAERVRAIVEQQLHETVAAALPKQGATITRLPVRTGYHPIDNRQLLPSLAAR